ncbi:MAG: ATP synthase F1 subunit epsilon [Candidatus Buchananbacteria bacterium RIFCSPHIGHO2_01_FULL_44_11]|uniref:ATP synthase epsilon chain n=1 Tax=Candidatus Buchananbacteria bacterium RIFCSPHIGHO2_01_FULL_44_11 TaxID=1797535 RepID=A0A1G1XZB8_9BACT|nr:MAG: ATP synthase F1 subunit epsilon [Candidatus Buchananbacteria bacterium RIFCSPHIGHO2_01_FULL_44_11]
MPKIKFKIVTPERLVYQKDVDQVTLPTKTGEITVLPNHIPLVALLAAGELVAKVDGQELPMAVSRGFIEVGKNSVTVLTQTAEGVEEIDELRAQAAVERAKKLLQDVKNKEAVEYTALAGKIEKELARLKVVRRRKHTHQPTIKSE